ncbi:hypothetical protein AMTRI_Chr01g108180 [Amborella trichopoda]
MMVTLVPGQHTLNYVIFLSTLCTTTSKHGAVSSFAIRPLTTSTIEDTIYGKKSELAELNGNTLAFQNMLMIVLAFSINIPADGFVFVFFNDIVACGDQVQRVCESLVAHLWVHVGE